MTELQKQFLQEYVDAYEAVFFEGKRNSANLAKLDEASENLDKHFASDEVPSWYKGAYKWAKALLKA